MENKRYEELNKKIKQWHKAGYDENILQSLFGQANLTENELVDRSEDLKEKTMFSDLSNEELLARYEKKYFNRYTNRELKHLFQESHNRFMKDSGIQVTRNVLVQNNFENKDAIGWVYSDQDLLFMNKYSINRGKEQKDTNYLRNEYSIGKIILKTLLHETKHNIQYEDAIDFALGVEQEEDRAFAGALMIINNANFGIAAAQSDEEHERYAKHWKDHYNYHAYEHEANYCSNERIIKYYGNNPKDVKLDYAQTLLNNAVAVMRFQPNGTKKENEKLLAERVDKIEEYAKYQIEYFEKGTQDCPLRTRILETLHNYVDVDENGNSPLRTRMTRENKEMYNQYISALKMIKNLQQKENKQDEEKGLAK